MSQRLLFTDDVARATAEIARLGGRVLQVLTPSVVVAEWPDDVELTAATRIRPTALDEASARLADAWALSRSKHTPSTTLPWDSPGKERP